MSKIIEISNITLKMLVDSGILPIGTILYPSKEYEVKALINNRAEIEITLNNESKVYSYPSGAARAVVKFSVNGWRFWKVKYNESFVELGFFRHLYHQQFMV